MIEKLTLRKALEFAIKTEQLGAAFYDKQAARHSGDQEITELFSVLARDEEIHEAQFKTLMKKLPAGERQELSEADEEYLRAIATAEFFYGDHEVLDPADKVATRDDALARAMSMERASLMYYGAMRDVLGASDVLDSIIQAEKDHLLKVMKYAFTGAQMRGLIDDQV